MATPRETQSRLELLAYLLEKVMSVNGFFISAGYGVFFGIWAFFKDTLPHATKVTAGLFLMVSASLFVAWHLISAVTLSCQVRAILNNPPQTRGRSWLAVVRIESSKLVQALGIPMTLVSAGLAAVGILILGVGLLRSL